MDEFEQRLAALELLAIEILADIEPAARDAAAARIRYPLRRPIDTEEAKIRRQALQLLDDAACLHITFPPDVEI